jgi:hypothetical protein
MGTGRGLRRTEKPSTVPFISSVSLIPLSTNGGLLFTVLLIQLLLFLPYASSDNWEYKLVHDLLDGYESSIRPSVNHNATLNVTFGLSLAQIIDVVISINEKKMH